MTVEDIALVVDRQFAAVNKETHQRVNDDLRRSVVEVDKRFRESIKYWVSEGRALIVDGHRRFALWQSLPDDTPVPPPLVEELQFGSRLEAEAWIRLESISRRNLTPQEYALQRGRLVKLWTELLEAGGEVSGQSVQKPPAPHRNSGKATGGRPRSHRRAATEAVAERTGVSTKTVERDVAYAQAIDTIGTVNAKAKADIERGTLTIPRSTVVEIGALDRSDIGKAIGNVRNGRAWDDGIGGKQQRKLQMPEERSAVAEARSLLDKLESIIDDIPDDEREPIAVRIRRLVHRIDPPSATGLFIKPTVAEVRAYCEERGNGIDAEEFVDFYESKGWVIGKSKMKDWRATVRTWEKEHKKRNGRQTKGLNDDAFAEVFGR